MDLFRLPTGNLCTLSNLFDVFPNLKPVYRSFESALLKSRRCKLQLRFLEQCRAEHILPPSFSHPLHLNSSGSPFPDYARLFLQDHILSAKYDVEDAFFSLRHKHHDLVSPLPPDLATFLLDQAHSAARRHHAVHSARLDNKLSRLVDMSPWSRFSLTNCVSNLSSHPLSKYELELLGFGLSFSTSPLPRSGVDLISSFDTFSRRHSNRFPDFSTLRGALLPALDSLFSKDNHLPRRYQCALSSLKSNSDIMIFPSDKGNSVVVLDKEDYLRKANLLLSDSNTYSPLRSNPLERIQKTFNSTLRRLSDLCPEDFDLVKRFRVICPSLPYFYGLPKTHKPDVPLRPIISSRGSVSHPLASWLAKILTPYLGSFSSSHLLHSSDFIDRLRNLSPERMLSLDVESLFTNVPLDDVLSFLRTKVTEGTVQLPLPTDVFLDLIRLCVDSNSFSFHGKFYSQIFGVAMGSPLSPVLANLYMEYFESVLLPTLHVLPSLWIRYVDDVFALWPHYPSLFPDFLSSLNNLAPSINFKVEWENSSKLPFLDVLVHKSDFRFTFSVYRKPMHSGMYIHYFSYHPQHVKKGVLVSLFLRALRICDPQFLDFELTHLRQSFSRLGYPPRFISQALSQAKRSFYSPPPPPTPTPPPPKPPVLCLPYIAPLQNLSQLMCR